MTELVLDAEILMDRFKGHERSSIVDLTHPAVIMSINPDYEFKSPAERGDIASMYKIFLSESLGQELETISRIFFDYEKRSKVVNKSNLFFKHEDFTITIGEALGRVILSISKFKDTDREITLTACRALATEQFPSNKHFGLNFILGSINQVKEMVKELNHLDYVLHTKDYYSNIGTTLPARLLIDRMK